jgi:methylenetetrahydrofolate reductase (NADPH)
MKIRDIIERRGKTLSFEFFPPKTQRGETILFETIKKLSVFNPDYVSVTYGAGGTTKDKTMSAVERINRDNPFTVVSHLTGIGCDKKEITEIVEYYKRIGIENILAIRGDPTDETSKLPEVKNGFNYAKDLIAFLNNFNSFCIGAGVYPEGHPDAPDLSIDMIYTKEKIAAGADFLVTQMFFDNRFFYDFLRRADKAGINVPIIPGIMLLNNFPRVKQLAGMCKATIPVELDKLMTKYEDSPESIQEVSIDYTTKQCEDLLSQGVKHFHFYTLNQWQIVSKVIENLSLKVKS